jgi:heterodisulfide reductase subunit A
LDTKQKKVMVIGGGIAGLTAAWEMARKNIAVDLVEKAGFLGGHAIQYSCKATDECQQCGACSVEAMLKNVVAESLITVHLGAQVETVNKNGRFEISLKDSDLDHPDDAKCTGAYEKAPMDCAAARGYSRHNALFYDADGRLDPEKAGKTEKLAVDAIILASGFQPFAAEKKATYNYGIFDNVITGLDLERCKRSYGDILRPSDKRVPEKIAFIQCVGSRDERLGNLWCSQACCPYALRSAQALKYKYPDMDITIFYMDIQNTGKDYTKFNDKCREDLNFIRTIPVDMYKTEDDKIRTRFMDDEGKPTDGIFDLVVLSIGITPGADNHQLTEILGIDLDADGFFQASDMLSTTISAKSGIFIAGTAQGPKTIAVSMAHAGQAAREAIRFVREAK